MQKFLILFLLIFSNSTLGAEKPQYFGWIPHQKSEKHLQKTIYDEQLSELVKWNDDTQDAYLYRFLYQAMKDAKQLNQSEIQSGRLDSLDQGQVGSCVGYGTSIALDTLMAANAYHKKQLLQIWLSRVHPPAIYAIGRNEHRQGFDGSTGIWQVEGLQKYGSLHRLKYDSYDLTQVNQMDARKWASQGLPGNLLEDAKEHKLVNYALVDTLDKAKAALQNGYPLILCSSIGYNNQRDQNGFLRRQGSWMHCMACTGYRSADTGKEGYLIIQSWGNNWAGGPIFPDDMPQGAFWVTPQDLMAHLREKDSFALSDYQGFKRREIKWLDVFNFNGEISEDE